MPMIEPFHEPEVTVPRMELPETTRSVVEAVPVIVALLDVVVEKVEVPVTESAVAVALVNVMFSITEDVPVLIIFPEMIRVGIVAVPVIVRLVAVVVPVKSRSLAVILPLPCSTSKLLPTTNPPKSVLMVEVALVLKEKAPLDE